MAVSGDAQLERDAPAGLVTLAQHQARNGQIPKFVDVHRDEADFWYLGCIDATLWWLIAIAWLDRLRSALRPAPDARDAISTPRSPGSTARSTSGSSCCSRTRRATGPTSCRAPASCCTRTRCGTWSSGCTTCRSARRRASTSTTCSTRSRRTSPSIAARACSPTTRASARATASCISASSTSRSSATRATRSATCSPCCAALADDARLASHAACAACSAHVDDPYPVRAVCDPIVEADALWRPYMSRHRQNYAWQYHNGGIWPFVGGFYIAALAQAGLVARGGRPARKACPRERARRLGVRRVAARPDPRAVRNARAVLERGGVPARAERARAARRPVRGARRSAGPASREGGTLVNERAIERDVLRGAIGPAEAARHACTLDRKPDGVVAVGPHGTRDRSP